MDAPNFRLTFLAVRRNLKFGRLIIERRGSSTVSRSWERRQVTVAVRRVMCPSLYRGPRVPHVTRSRRENRKKRKGKERKERKERDKKTKRGIFAASGSPMARADAAAVAVGGPGPGDHHRVRGMFCFTVVRVTILLLADKGDRGAVRGRVLSPVFG